MFTSSQIRSIHFVGICGTAMGNVAVQLHQMGYRITGSDDNFYPPMSTFLEENKITVYKNFSSENLAHQPDLVVIGNAISRGNPEAEWVLARKIPHFSLPQLLREFFLWRTRNIVVTGTHGKTTTATLVAHLLTTAGRNPNFLIGGIPLNFGKGFHYSGGEYFVLEGDEYDTAFFDKRSKFIHYLPDYAIINNIEYDHSDIFPNLEAIKTTFRHFVKIIPDNGLLVVNADDPIVQEVVTPHYSPLESFGFSEHAHWRITGLELGEKGSHFGVSRGGKRFGEFQLPQPGRHNVLNACAAIAVAAKIGIPVEQLQEGLVTFKGVKRRLELRGRIAGIDVYDDFAHHPTAIRATIESLRRTFPGRRIWAVFEPRTNTTRRRIFQEELADALSLADGVCIGRINRAHLLPENDRLDRAAIVKYVTGKAKPAFFADQVEALIDWLLPQLSPGDAVVIMSNGGFDGLHDKLLTALQSRQENE